MDEWYLLSISVTYCSVIKYSKLSGEILTILLCPGTCWVRKLGQSRDCHALWFGNTWWAGLTQRLNLAETLDQRIDTQPLHVILLPIECGHVLRGIILRTQKRIQVTAAWPLSLSLRGHIASLPPCSMDQSSHKSAQIQEEGTWTPLRELYLGVWGSCFKTAKMKKTRN